MFDKETISLIAIRNIFILFVYLFFHLLQEEHDLGQKTLDTLLKPGLSQDIIEFHSDG